MFYMAPHLKLFSEDQELAKWRPFNFGTSKKAEKWWQIFMWKFPNKMPWFIATIKKTQNMSEHTNIAHDFKQGLIFPASFWGFLYQKVFSEGQTLGVPLVSALNKPNISWTSKCLVISSNYPFWWSTLVNLSDFRLYQQYPTILWCKITYHIFKKQQNPMLTAISVVSSPTKLQQFTVPGARTGFV